VSSLPPLTGAQDEARAVEQVLVPAFPAVRTLVRPTSNEVMAALFERPFKMLHLAGHGVYRQAVADLPRSGGSEASEPPQAGKKGATVTGMVLGDGVYLTPGAVEQMRSVPDLVFINCCHLGQMDVGLNRATPQERAFPSLASNLATEFIRMGVRAVVAAGWAVADKAALTFASSFYKNMLAGESFGQSVKTAREDTFKLHSDLNTWGAYQCYGDPDFRLVLTAQVGADAGPPAFLSPAHAIRDIGNIAARLKTESSTSRAVEVRRLRQIVEVLDRKGWKAHGAIASALGRAFAEAGELEVATDYYCSALRAEDGAVTARDIEQWANLMARNAASRWSRNRTDPDVTKQCVRQVKDAIHILRNVLSGRNRERETGERLALIGSAYKRLAWIESDPAARRAALEQMADFYGKGVERRKQAGMEHAYHLLNVRWAELAMHWQGMDGVRVAAWNLAAELEAVRAELMHMEQDEGPQFWQDSLRVDCQLLETVHKGAATAAQVASLAQEYLSWRDYASAREFASICDHLDFLVVMSGPLAELNPLLASLREQVGNGRAAAANA
jgi:hypothetical protein